MGAGSSKTKDTDKENAVKQDNDRFGQETNNLEISFGKTTREKQSTKNDKQEGTSTGNYDIFEEPRDVVSKTDIVQLDNDNEEDVTALKSPKKEVHQVRKKSKVKDGGKTAWKMSKSREKETDKRLMSDGKNVESFQAECLEYELEGEDDISIMLKQGKEDIHVRDTENINQGQEIKKFDPTQIIDINKFRAANAPEKKTKVQEKVSELTTYQDYKLSPQRKNQTTLKQNNEDINQNIMSSTENSTPRLSKAGFVVYDEEEEQLMESIEKEYYSDDALPGAVLSS